MAWELWRRAGRDVGKGDVENGDDSECEQLVVVVRVGVEIPFDPAVGPKMYASGIKKI